MASLLVGLVHTNGLILCYVVVNEEGDKASERRRRARGRLI